jgi:DNA-binding SARP family transcriptional activator
MEFRILGPLEVLDGDRPLALGGPKQRALLAVLLLHANDVVAVERLVDELWGESPPATVAKSVQVYVSRLRRELGEDRLRTRAPGYTLRVEPGELDAARFEALAAEAAAARPERAGELLRAALGLWRGPALADLAYEPFAQAAVARLEEQRLGVLEQRIDADLEAGRAAELVGELEALIREHPLREGLRGRLMLALYRSSRQADALAAFADARRTLDEELGLEPGPELRALQAAILRQDPGLARQDRAAGRARTTFVGRRRELDVLERGLEDALAGSGRLVLVAGEPGIGKSRLIEELADRAEARGAGVVVGRCWEAGGAPAYWPWVQACRACLRDRDPAALGAELGASASDLAQLLPELREAGPGVPEAPAGNPESSRFRLFAAATAFLRAAGAAAPLVVVLDDLHAADEPSLLLLRFLARELAGSRLLVVCAFRDVDPTPSDPLTLAVAELVREPATTQIELGPLPEAAVAEYIARATEAPAPSSAIAAISAATEGHPLFLVEVVRLLAAEGGIAGQGQRPQIPSGIRAVIDRRLSRLSAPCRELLIGAAVLGREFPLDALAELSGQAPDRVADSLEEAMEERIVAEVPGSPGRLRFSHALIRDAVYDGQTAAARLRLHRRAGAALEAVHAADLDPHLAELARHFLAAAPSGTAAEAVGYARRAGDRAVSLLAYEEAARLYSMALPLVDDPMARCELLLALGDARARAGDTPGSKQDLLQAAELAMRAGLAEHLSRAALGYGGRIIWEVSRDDEHLVPLLEAALAALGPGSEALRVRLLARLAGGPLRDASHPPERRAALSEEALAVARTLDDPETLAYAIHGYILGHHSPAHTPKQLELATELVAVAQRAGDAERVVEGREERLVALVELGDVAGARAELEAMERGAAELRQPAHAWLTGVYRALLTLLAGDLAAAEELITATRELGRRAQSWNAEVSYRLQLYVLRCAQEREAELADLIRRSVAEYPTYPIFRCALVHVDARSGRAPEAGGALDALAPDAFAAVPFDEEWLVSMGFLAEAACALGASDHAAVIHGLLLPYADRIAICYPEVATGAVARHLGLLAAATGRLELADEHLSGAIAVHERAGARGWVERTRRERAAVAAQG